MIQFRREARSDSRHTVTAAKGRVTMLAKKSPISGFSSWGDGDEGLLTPFENVLHGAA